MEYGSLNSAPTIHARSLLRERCTVGWSTVKAIFGNKLLPPLGDDYLAHEGSRTFDRQANSFSMELRLEIRDGGIIRVGRSAGNRVRKVSEAEAELSRVA
jgi:hypothetical protein